MRMSPEGSEGVMEQNSTWLVAGPNETNELWVFTGQSYGYHLEVTCACTA